MTAEECEPISDAIRRLLAERGPNKSICPSEIARRVDRCGWRARMLDVREAACALAARGQIEITQGDRRIEDPHAVRGPIRLRLPRG